MKASQSTVAGGSGSGSTGNATTLGRTGLGASTGQRLPVPPRERKPALAALAVLLILGGALASAYLVMASGQRVSAIQIAHPVAPGQRIPASALREVQIGDTGIEYVRWSERHRVTTAYAAVPLVEGALLTNAMTTPGDDAALGRVEVGLALKPGQLPADGLDPGTRVALYAVAGGQGGGPRPGTLLSADAIVQQVRTGGEDRLRGDQTMVDVAVPPADVALLTQAASAGAVAAVIVPEGTRIAPSQPAPAQQPTTGLGAGTGPGNGGQTNPRPSQTPAPGTGPASTPAGG
ncbi:hypothetical protein [Thermomonospora amylolytica]|uniref:hypothetical protein n=1 Tax=Thermomonospora amylolytica TaxID=1411117 RepID=UPI0018E55D49|nr:hypothetical protein [Thermomonospora amylolytica]